MALRYGEWWPQVINSTWWLFIAVISIGVPIFIRLGLYRAVVRYMGEQVISTVAKGVGLTTLLLAFIALLNGNPAIPRTSFFIFFGAAFLLVTGSRFLVRRYYQKFQNDGELSKQRVIIYGAGEAGSQVAKAMTYSDRVQPLAFVDDNPTLWGSTINGIPVHNPQDLAILIRRLNIDTILLAMPQLKRTKRFTIIKSLQHLPIEIRSIPGMADLASGRTHMEEFRPIEIDELLGRDQVTPDGKLLQATIRDRAVLVTGAGGSIGAELCRQILQLQPQCLVLFELSEFALYRIEQELLQIVHQHGLKVRVVTILGSVQDSKRLREVLNAFKIQTLYHAAAYKHVPLVEHNLIAGIRNNAFGTLVLTQTARDCGVELVVLISTDKAVRPTNAMGASKRLAELILQALADVNSHTRLCMVRFGNVLGSSGSVVPLFREQITKGGPITLTHKDIIRYFMTIPEAAQLVIQAGAMATGGEVFVLDMGHPVRIYDLACTMIRLSGLEVQDDTHPDGDIAITITGLRPGEKLYEELLVGDNPEPTAHPLIWRAYEKMLPWGQLQPQLIALEQACTSGNVAVVRKLLQQIVVDYTPNSAIVDGVWCAKGDSAGFFKAE